MPHGVALECLVTGVGEPTTVFAHGLAGGIGDTRPFGSAVAGRKVFFQFRGHGRSAAPPGPWTYADLATDLRAVADTFEATHALGVSLGAGALCRLLTQTPDRFARVVLVLPATLDRPRGRAATDRITALLRAVESGDTAQAAELLTQEIPTSARNTPAAWRYLRERLDALLKEGLAAELAGLPQLAAVPDRAALAGVSAQVLVIGCHGDRAHPASVAEAVAAALPAASLHLYARPGLLWTQRTDLRGRIAGFLNAP
jgi:3-oxoadipate enol-lactonase